MAGLFAENHHVIEGQAAHRLVDQPTGTIAAPTEGATNAMLSFVSGMLTRDCAQAVANAGMDALVGLYHTAHHGRPALALDLSVR